MNSYHSQNNESEIAINYFKGRKGTLLDIGANDAITYSNSYDLIALGWSGILIEPSSAYKLIDKVHAGNGKVSWFNIGIGEKLETVTFYESANHVPNGTDTCLVSTVHQEETIRWRKNGVQFRETEIELWPFKGFWNSVGKPKLDFISLDVEGHETQILKQIDLNEVGCDMICIEWNGVVDLKRIFTNHCLKYRLQQVHQNAENIIFAR